MIYKFENPSFQMDKDLEITCLEIEQYGNLVRVTLDPEGGNLVDYFLDREDLYNLIGVLHSLQTKIKNEYE